MAATTTHAPANATRERRRQTGLDEATRMTKGGNFYA
jgi:hypothetical protein